MEKHNWKYYVMVRLLTLQLLFFLVFLFFDLFVPKAAAYGNALKFMTTVFAWGIGILGNAPMIAIGLTVTMVCDYILLFTNQYAIGLLLFSLAHWCYAGYHYDRRRAARRIYSFVPLPLLFSASFYAASLVCDVLSGMKDAAERPALETRYFAIGIILFFLCDVTTAYFYFSKSAAAAALIWVFYTPAQAFIAVSAFFAKGRPLLKKLYLGAEGRER